MTADGRTAMVELDPTVYRLEAIKKAAYKFGDRCFVQIDTCANGRVVIILKTKRVLMDDLEQLAGEFRNEVLDQELREVVAKETEAVRNLLLAQAFSKTALLDPTGEAADFRDDPLNIRADQV
jgi:His-Xaa-Ser system protein HxsD